jgi:hypothetical protein
MRVTQLGKLREWERDCMRNREKCRESEDDSETER